MCKKILFNIIVYIIINIVPTNNNIALCRRECSHCMIAVSFRAISQLHCVYHCVYHQSINIKYNNDDDICIILYEKIGNFQQLIFKCQRIYSLLKIKQVLYYSLLLERYYRYKYIILFIFFLFFREMTKILNILNEIARLQNYAIAIIILIIL